jgi:Domain of unknown function (DUF6321)
MRFNEIISEDANPKRQAAIAIAMKKAGKKPKSEGMEQGIADEGMLGFLTTPKQSNKQVKPNSEEMRQYFAREKSKEPSVYNKNTTQKPQQVYTKHMAEGESTILSPGTEVTVPHKGKMVPGKIVRYDSGKGIDSPAYIVDISEYESLIVPVSRVKQDMDEGENWSKYNHKRVGGMSKKSVSSYRRSHPGSKIQTAVTTKPSKLKKGSKAAARRKSFCARMRGMKKHRTGAKTAHDPNSNINKSLRRWHCESIEELHELVMLAEQFIRNNKK